MKLLEMGGKVFQVVVDSKRDKGEGTSTSISEVHGPALGSCRCCLFPIVFLTITAVAHSSKATGGKSHETFFQTRSLPDSLSPSFSSPLLMEGSPSLWNISNSIQDCHNLGT